MGNHYIILEKTWIKKHKVIINIKNHSLDFCFIYFIYIRAIFSIRLMLSKILIKITVVKIEKNITILKIIQSSIQNHMRDFLQMQNKFFSQKKRQINKTQLKTSLKKTKPNKPIINYFNNFEEKESQVFKQATIKSELKAQYIITIGIYAEVYYVILT